MDLETAIGKAVQDFHKDPRNKLFVDSQLLLESARVETGKKLSAAALRSTIRKYLEGEASEKDLAIYDGAVAVCGELARRCFGSSADEDVEYGIEWIEDDSGCFTAQVRTN